MLLKALKEAVLGRDFGPRSGLLVACSGGLDSVVLAHAAVSLFGGRRVWLGHVDHAVREESAADLRFVEALAEQLGAGFLGTRLPPGSDDEARLREARYEALFAMREAEQLRWLLTAHTQDDQAETVLMKLIARTHPSSLAGMPAERGALLRPWLRVSRSEIAAYARRHDLAFREDPSNREPRYLRNRIRKELLPLLESRYRPNLRYRLARLAWLAEEEAAQGSRPGSEAQKPSPKIVPKDAPKDAARATLPAIAIEKRAYAGEALGDGKTIALFDASAMAFPVIAPHRPGDRIQPYGMLGRRKVRDILRESGIPAAAREGLYLARDGLTGEILWIPGLLRSAIAPVWGSTREVWVLRIPSEQATVGQTA